MGSSESTLVKMPHCHGSYYISYSGDQFCLCKHCYASNVMLYYIVNVNETCSYLRK